MSRLQSKLLELEHKKRSLERAIVNEKKRRFVDCASCQRKHQIGKLDLIQTHHYVPPSGCSEGDYWVEGELQFPCPETGVLNRILFNTDDVPYEKRREYENDPQAQFKRNYGPAFYTIEETRGETKHAWVNNYSIDENRSRFGLVEKRSSKKAK